MFKTYHDVISNKDSLCWVLEVLLLWSTCLTIVCLRFQEDYVSSNVVEINTKGTTYVWKHCEQKEEMETHIKGYDKLTRGR